MSKIIFVLLWEKEQNAKWHVPADQNGEILWKVHISQLWISWLYSLPFS